MRCRRSEPRAIAGLIALLVALEAGAAVRRFDMTTDAASNSEGEIELEGWLDFGRPQLAPSGVTNGMAWLGARFGLLDSLELSGFLVLEKSEGLEGTGDDSSGLMMWLSEVRWRPVEVGKWPIDLFLQVQLMHWFERAHPTQFRVTLGVSKNLGPVLLALNFSYWDSLAFQNAAGARAQWQWLDLSLGVAVNVIETDGSVPSVNIGIEAWSLIEAFEVRVHNHLLLGGGAVVGPTVALARGRLWLTGHLGVPLYVPGTGGVGGGIGFNTPLVGRVMLGISL